MLGTNHTIGNPWLWFPSPLGWVSEKVIDVRLYVCLTFPRSKHDPNCFICNLQFSKYYNLLYLNISQLGIFLLCECSRRVQFNITVRCYNAVLECIAKMQY